MLRKLGVSTLTYELGRKTHYSTNPTGAWLKIGRLRGEAQRGCEERTIKKKYILYESKISQTDTALALAWCEVYALGQASHVSAGRGGADIKHKQIFSNVWKCI